jgi:phenylacetate-CoA ligase
MKPIKALPPTRLQPAPRGRETLVQLVSDLLRMPWEKVDWRHYLDDYRGSQWLPPTPLRELQLAKLRRLVWHCFLNVPWYGTRIDEHFRPSTIERLEGLARIPIVRAGDRADDAPFVSVTQETVVEELRTSGTTGPARAVRLDADARERRTAVRLRVEEWAGAPPGKLVAAWGRESVHEPRALDAAELGALTTALARVRGQVVSGPGPSLQRLAVALKDAPAVRASFRDRLLGREGPRGVIARGADPDAGGAQLASLLEARLTRVYATAEVGMIAATCDRAPSPAAMHVQADHVIVEILDGDGRVLPPGATGRIYVTDLHNYAAPYLRYQLGDVGRLLAQPCPCGRALPLLEIDGRDEPTVPGRDAPSIH